MTSIKNYYINKYGSPEREAEFVSPDGKRVEIYKWNESQSDEGVVMYATVGTSILLGCDKRGCEFFIGITPAVDSIVQALAEVALHGNGSGNVPFSGDTVSLAYPLWKDTEVKTFMFTDGDEIMPPCNVAGKRVEFIQLVPLFEEELQFKKKCGEEALWAKFEDEAVPYWDSAR